MQYITFYLTRLFAIFVSYDKVVVSYENLPALDIDIGISHFAG
jgi:hypothetical protein